MWFKRGKQEQVEVLPKKIAKYAIKPIFDDYIEEVLAVKGKMNYGDFIYDDYTLLKNIEHYMTYGMLIFYNGTPDKFIPARYIKYIEVKKEE